MSVTELMQSLEMGQKTCRLTLSHAGEESELYFVAGQCKHAQAGSTEGDTVVYQAIGWLDGEFEIEFDADRTAKPPRFPPQASDGSHAPDGRSQRKRAELAFQ